jgi:hypothetical protein
MFQLNMDYVISAGKYNTKADSMEKCASSCGTGRLKH